MDTFMVRYTNLGSLMPLVQLSNAMVSATVGLRDTSRTAFPWVAGWAHGLATAMVSTVCDLESMVSGRSCLVAETEPSRRHLVGYTMAP
jgi:hypothetical protein